MEKLIKTQTKLIKLLEDQITQLTLLSKIELGDDVIKRIIELKSSIENLKLLPNPIQFISEVEIFNETMGKSESNQKQPTLNNKSSQDFVYNFILEELNEYKEACEQENIIGVADALGDIMYVLCNGIMVHGLKDKFLDIYEEIQGSNMSKSCENEDIAKQTVIEREKSLGMDCYYEKVGDRYVVFRSKDKKVQKSINYYSPNLKKFFK